VPNFMFISRLLGQKYGISKTIKIWNFGHKFQGRLACTFLRNFQRLYASIGSF